MSNRERRWKGFLRSADIPWDEMITPRRRQRVADRVRAQRMKFGRPRGMKPATVEEETYDALRRSERIVGGHVKLDLNSSGLHFGHEEENPAAPQVNNYGSDGDEDSSESDFKQSSMLAQYREAKSRSEKKKNPFPEYEYDESLSSDTDYEWEEILKDPLEADISRGPAESYRTPVNRSRPNRVTANTTGQMKGQRTERYGEHHMAPRYMTHHNARVPHEVGSRTAPRQHMSGTGGPYITGQDLISAVDWEDEDHGGRYHEEVPQNIQIYRSVVQSRKQDMIPSESDDADDDIYYEHVDIPADRSNRGRETHRIPPPELADSINASRNSDMLNIEMALLEKEKQRGFHRSTAQPPSPISIPPPVSRSMPPPPPGVVMRDYEHDNKDDEYLTGKDLKYRTVMGIGQPEQKERDIEADLLDAMDSLRVENSMIRAELKNANGQLNELQTMSQSHEHSLTGWDSEESDEENKFSLFNAPKDKVAPTSTRKTPKRSPGTKLIITSPRKSIERMRKPKRVVVGGGAPKWAPHPLLGAKYGVSHRKKGGGKDHLVATFENIFGDQMNEPEKNELSRAYMLLTVACDLATAKGDKKTRIPDLSAYTAVALPSLAILLARGVISSVATSTHKSKMSLETSQKSALQFAWACCRRLPSSLGDPDSSENYAGAIANIVGICEGPAALDTPLIRLQFKSRKRAKNLTRFAGQNMPEGAQPLIHSDDFTVRLLAALFVLKFSPVVDGVIKALDAISNDLSRGDDLAYRVNVFCFLGGPATLKPYLRSGYRSLLVRAARLFRALTEEPYNYPAGIDALTRSPTWFKACATALRSGDPDVQRLLIQTLDTIVDFGLLVNPDHFNPAMFDAKGDDGHALRTTLLEILHTGPDNLTIVVPIKRILKRIAG